MKKFPDPELAKASLSESDKKRKSAKGGGRKRKAPSFEPRVVEYYSNSLHEDGQATYQDVLSYCNRIPEFLLMEEGTRKVYVTRFIKRYKTPTEASLPSEGPRDDQGTDQTKRQDDARRLQDLVTARPDTCRGGCESISTCSTCVEKGHLNDGMAESSISRRTRAKQQGEDVSNNGLGTVLTLSNASKGGQQNVISCSIRPQAAVSEEVDDDDDEEVEEAEVEEEEAEQQEDENGDGVDDEDEEGKKERDGSEEEGAEVDDDDEGGESDGYEHEEDDEDDDYEDDPDPEESDDDGPFADDFDEPFDEKVVRLVQQSNTVVTKSKMSSRQRALLMKRSHSAFSFSFETMIRH
ncbi:unnamed protein product [Phytophthora fragariaefolia]|uniref:Unnamed protein product n=1 Tax=Phytophthora fragariaefolia TaxID=1490495 RepID=A0A9W6Y826_9STRA|nr:unnamed protein product [Phytophthora fragariaefolia]